MKVCSACGDTYQDFVDFCFRDGEVLEAAGAGVESSAEGADGAPSQPVRLPPSVVATPVPRGQRRPPTSPGSRPSPEPSPQEAAADPGAELDREEDEPSAASLERTQPIEIRRQPLKAPPPAPPAPAPQDDLYAEEGDSSMIMIGVAAAMLGGGLLIAAGLLVLGMTTGLIGVTPASDAAPSALPALPRDPMPEILVPVPGLPPAPPAEVAPPSEVAPTPAADIVPTEVASPSALPELVGGAPGAEPVPSPTPQAPIPAQPTPLVAPPAEAPAEAPAPAVSSVKVVLLAPDQPAPAEVQVDGRAVPCAVPCTISLAPGTHQIRVVQADGSAFELSPEIPAALSHQILLQPSP
jgi:hypothetical protein